MSVKMLDDASRVALVMVGSNLPANGAEPDGPDACAYACALNMYAHALTINMRYARRHHYDFLFYLNEGPRLSFHGRHAAWSKLVALEHALFVRDTPLALYIDADAFVHNPHVELSAWLSESIAYRQLPTLEPLVRPGDEALAFLDNRPYDWDMGPTLGQRRYACTGIMMLKRRFSTHCFLSHWWFASTRLQACPLRQEGRLPCPSFDRDHDWEQGPLNGAYLLNRSIKERIAVLDVPSMYRQPELGGQAQLFLHLTGFHLPSMSGRLRGPDYDGGKGAHRILRNALRSTTTPPMSAERMQSSLRDSIACLLANRTGSWRKVCAAAFDEGEGLSHFEWYALNESRSLADVWRQVGQRKMFSSRRSESERAMLADDQDRRFCKTLRAMS